MPSKVDVDERSQMFTHTGENSNTSMQHSRSQYVFWCVCFSLCTNEKRRKKVEVTSCDIPSRDDSNQPLMGKPQSSGWESIKVGKTREEEGDKERKGQSWNLNPNKGRLRRSTCSHIAVLYQSTCILRTGRRSWFGPRGVAKIVKLLLTFWSFYWRTFFGQDGAD